MENQSHTKTIAYIVLGVVIVIALVLFVSSDKTASQEPVPNVSSSGPSAPDPQVIATQKAEIQALVQSGRILTATEKQMIFERLNGERINSFGFTDEEKNSIVETLNRK